MTDPELRELAKRLKAGAGCLHLVQAIQEKRPILSRDMPHPGDNHLVEILMFDRFHGRRMAYVRPHHCTHNYLDRWVLVTELKPLSPLEWLAYQAD